jgi:hypothetical protein
VTEQEWLKAKTVINLDLWRSAKNQHRKWRLFAVACCRRAMGLAKDDRLEPVAVAAERFADEEMGWEEVKQSRKVLTKIRKEIDDQFGPKETLYDTLDALNSASSRKPVDTLACHKPCTYAFAAVSRRSHAHDAWDRALNNEEREQVLLARCIFGNPFRLVAFSPSWRSESAVALARTAYDTRNFTLLPILADALEDAGCDHADLLAHCRDPKAPHARGCWVVDLVLNKS